MIPTRTEAERILAESEPMNPGNWGNHSRLAAHCAESIAAACGLDTEKAYIVGLLHDIGRRFGKRHLGHVSDGYSYMMSLGYDEVAKICLTHSFHDYTLRDYIGKIDTTDEETALITNELSKVVPDDYDRLIQLCDAMAGGECILNIEDRIADVERRYGAYPESKRSSILTLRRYFEEKSGRDIYEVVDKDNFKL